jgi:hypothetical protein
MSTRLVVVPALLGVLAAPVRARADEAPVIAKRMWFAEKDGQLVVSASFAELFDKKAYDQLSSGFPTVVAVTATVYKQGSELPSAISFATFRVVYDLWDVVYLVHVVGPRGEDKSRFTSRAYAFKAITEIADFPLAPLARIAVGPRYVCGLTIERNPVSEEMLAEMRRWLTRRAGSAQLDPSSSFFGNVVSVFVNPKLQAADALLRLRSQPFYRVEQ